MTLKINPFDPAKYLDSDEAIAGCDRGSPPQHLHTALERRPGTTMEDAPSRRGRRSHERLT
jgi:hypothetical protein